MAERTPPPPRTADAEAAAAIRALQGLANGFFAMVPFSAEEIAEMPEFREEYARMERLADAWEATLLQQLGTDEHPRPILYDGKVYSRAGGKVVVATSPG